MGYTQAIPNCSIIFSLNRFKLKLDIPFYLHTGSCAYPQHSWLHVLQKYIHTNIIYTLHVVNYTIIQLLLYWNTEVNNCHFTLYPNQGNRIRHHVTCNICHLTTLNRVIKTFLWMQNEPCRVFNEPSWDLRSV